MVSSNSTCQKTCHCLYLRYVRILEGNELKGEEFPEWLVECWVSLELYIDPKNSGDKPSGQNGCDNT